MLQCVSCSCLAVNKEKKIIKTVAYLLAKYNIKCGAAANIDETFGNFCVEDKSNLEEKDCKKVTTKRKRDGGRSCKYTLLR